MDYQKLWDDLKNDVKKMGDLSVCYSDILMQMKLMEKDVQPIKFLEDFDYENCIGDMYDLDAFLEESSNGYLTPNDGCIGDVVVDGKLTNIRVRGWAFGYDKLDMDLEDLADIEGKVEIEWCNK